MTIAAPTSRAIPAIADDVPEIRRSVLRRAWIFCRRQPLGTFGMALVDDHGARRAVRRLDRPLQPDRQRFCGDDRAAELGALARHRSVRAGPPVAHHLWRAHGADRRLLVRDRRQRRRDGARCRQRLFRRPPRPLPAGGPRRRDGLSADHHGARRRRDLRHRRPQRHRRDHDPADPALRARLAFERACRSARCPISTPRAPAALAIRGSSCATWSPM